MKSKKIDNKLLIAIDCQCNCFIHNETIYIIYLN